MKDELGNLLEMLNNVQLEATHTDIDSEGIVALIGKVKGVVSDMRARAAISAPSSEGEPVAWASSIHIRPLDIPLEDYYNAVSGVGELAYDWSDKPHRLLYDLIADKLYSNTHPQPVVEQSIDDKMIELTAMLKNDPTLFTALVHKHGLSSRELLTDHEIDEICIDLWGNSEEYQLNEFRISARAIEAKLKG